MSDGWVKAIALALSAILVMWVLCACVVAFWRTRRTIYIRTAVRLVLAVGLSVAYGLWRGTDIIGFVAAGLGIGSLLILIGWWRGVLTADYTHSIDVLLLRRPIAPTPSDSMQGLYVPPVLPPELTERIDPDAIDWLKAGRFVVALTLFISLLVLACQRLIAQF